MNKFPAKSSFRKREESSGTGATATVIPIMTRGTNETRVEKNERQFAKTASDADGRVSGEPPQKSANGSLFEHRYGKRFADPCALFEPRRSTVRKHRISLRSSGTRGLRKRNRTVAKNTDLSGSPGELRERVGSSMRERKLRHLRGRLKQ